MPPAALLASLLPLLWLQADTDKTGSRLTYIPPAKPKLPGHEESYNPPKEYVPSGETLNSPMILPLAPEWGPDSD
jgi:ribosome biogenesis protein ERB1